MRSLGRSRPARAVIATVLAGACGLCAAWVALAAETRTTSLVSIGPDGGNGPFEAEYADTSDDGSRVFFETEDSLLAADSDEVTDVYERHGEALSLVTVGPQGGNAELAAYHFANFANGTRVLFGTDESLVSGDSDEAEDIYERSGGTTTLLSIGPEGGNGAANATYTASSADGSRIFFLTKEKLVSEDEDESRDLYERFAGTTTLLSTGPGGGNDAVDLSFVARSSADGLRVFFLTKEQLVKEDEDTAEDIYERFAGNTTLISTGAEGGNAETGVFGLQISTDGTRVFFTTSESLVGADGDTGSDGYERSGGVTSLITTGPSGNSGAVAYLQRISPDGTRAIFYTGASLVAADTDFQTDTYERSAGVTKLLSTGPTGGNGPHSAQPRGISGDGNHIYFVTDEQLTADDGDEVEDVYESSGGVTTLVSSGGNGPFGASFGGSSRDGARVYFVTADSLVPADGDAATDVYQRAAGVTTFVSTGPDDAEKGEGVYFGAVSPDGSHLFLNSHETLIAADTDEEPDLYDSVLDPLPAAPVPAPAQPPVAPPLKVAKAKAPRCAGKPATIVGTDKRDVLKGTGKRDVIVARGGNDKILGRGSNDLICAGGGKDVVKAGAGNDKVFGQGGPDRIFGQGGRDFLFGNAGRDFINGGSARDKCRGGGGRDRQRLCER